MGHAYEQLTILIDQLRIIKNYYEHLSVAIVMMYSHNYHSSKDRRNNQEAMHVMELYILVSVPLVV